MNSFNPQEKNRVFQADFLFSKSSNEYSHQLLQVSRLVGEPRPPKTEHVPPGHPEQNVETFITRQHLKRRHDISKKDFIQTCLWKKQLFISLEMSHGIFVAEIGVASVEAVVSLLPWTKKQM